jgi:hypothetical protein
VLFFVVRLPKKKSHFFVSPVQFLRLDGGAIEAGTSVACQSFMLHPGRIAQQRLRPIARDQR